MEMLVKAGLLAKVTNKSVTAPIGTILQYQINSVPWAGQELLDSISDDDVWSKTKEYLGDKLGSVSFAVIKSVAAEAVMDML